MHNTNICHCMHVFRNHEEKMKMKIMKYNKNGVETFRVSFWSRCFWVFWHVSASLMERKCPIKEQCFIYLLSRKQTFSANVAICVYMGRALFALLVTHLLLKGFTFLTKSKFDGSGLCWIMCASLLRLNAGEPDLCFFFFYLPHCWCLNRTNESF